MRFLQLCNKTLTTKNNEKARLNIVYIHTFLMEKAIVHFYGRLLFFVQTTIYAFFLLSGIISISSR